MLRFCLIRVVVVGFTMVVDAMAIVDFIRLVFLVVTVVVRRVIMLDIFGLRMVLVFTFRLRVGRL